MKKLILILLLLTGCSDMDNVEEAVYEKMSTVEYGLLHDYDIGVNQRQSILDYRVMLQAIKSREFQPPLGSIPFCDVAKYSLLVPDKINSINKRMSELFPEAWNKCLQDSKYGGRLFRGAIVPIDPQDQLTSKTLKELTEVARDCHIAKVSLSILEGEGLTETKGLEIIRSCRVFKLQEELQK